VEHLNCCVKKSGNRHLMIQKPGFSISQKLCARSRNFALRYNGSYKDSVLFPESLDPGNFRNSGKRRLIIQIFCGWSRNSGPGVYISQNFCAHSRNVAARYNGPYKDSLLFPESLDTRYSNKQRFCLNSRNSGKRHFIIQIFCGWSRISGPGVFISQNFCAR
jgi:hypothetical protein